MQGLSYAQGGPPVPVEVAPSNGSVPRGIDSHEADGL